MGFQPFGYQFEVRSPSPPSEVKAIIRSRKKGWFDMKRGARGWIVGPFICLWGSAFHRNGPMLFGLISQDILGTRVRGRAGSDLNGVLMCTLLIPLTIFATFQLIADRAGLLLLLVAVVFPVFGVGWLKYWFAHKDRREAETLVRFLRDALTVSGKALRAKSEAMTVTKPFTLNVSGNDLVGPVTPDAIHEALLDAGEGDFVILSSDEEMYLQTVSRCGGYIIERRDGDKQRHFQAIRQISNPTTRVNLNVIFTFEEVHEVFIAYATGSPMPHFLTWECMRFA